MLYGLVCGSKIWLISPARQILHVCGLTPDVVEKEMDKILNMNIRDEVREPEEISLKLAKEEAEKDAEIEKDDDEEILIEINEAIVHSLAVLQEMKEILGKMLEKRVEEDLDRRRVCDA